MSMRALTSDMIVSGSSGVLAVEASVVRRDEAISRLSFGVTLGLEARAERDSMSLVRASGERRSDDSDKRSWSCSGVTF